MLVPQSEELVLLCGLAALFVLALGAGRARRVREFLRFVRDALYDEWRWPR